MSINQLIWNGPQKTLHLYTPYFPGVVVIKPPHEHDLCRWPRLDPLIVGVCAGECVCWPSGCVLAAGYPTSKSKSKSKSKSEPNCQQSRSDPSQAKDTYIRQHTPANSHCPHSPCHSPQHMPHSPTKAPSLSNIPCSIERAHNHAHSVSTCAFWPPSGNWQYQYPIPNNRYQNQMQLQINAPCGGGFFPKKVCAQRSCQKWACNWNSLLAKQHTRTCGDQV